MDNTKPLYQQLNEERTQGVFVIDGDVIVSTDDPENFPKSYNDGIVVFEAATNENTTDECIAPHFSQIIPNLRYTCLAVNNMHKIAEALENFIGCFDTPVMRRKCLNDFQKECIEIGKQALADIS